MVESVNIMNTVEVAERFRNQVQLLTKQNQISDENKHLLTIVNNHFDIYHYQQYGMFAALNDTGEDTFHIRDINEDLTGNFNISSIDTKNNINYLIRNGYIKDIDESKIIDNSFFPSTFLFSLAYIDAFVESWMKSEYKDLNTELSKPQYAIEKFNTNLLNRSKYEFEDVINNVDDPQFTRNLEEILKAYSEGWFFVASTAVGGLIENLLYKTALNYNRTDFNRENPTKIDFTAKLKELAKLTKKLKLPEEQRIHFEIQDELTLDRDYLTRNAVSHYNSGFANESEVNALFTALHNTYQKYFLPSLKYKKEHSQSY